MKKKIKEVGIRLKSNGSYISEKMINGKRYSKNFKSIREAKYWRKNFHPTLCPEPKQSNPLTRNSSSLNGIDRSITIEEVFHEYKHHRICSLGKSQQYKKELIIKNFFKQLMDFKLCYFNQDVLIKYLKLKVDQAKINSPQRYNFDRDLKEIKAMFNWYKAIKDNSYTCPVTRYHYELGVVRPKNKKELKITLLEFSELIDSFTDKQELFQDMAIIQFYTASRIGEIAGIKRSNVDLVNRSLRIDCVIEWAKKQPPIIKESTKTGEVKYTYINDSMFEVLKKRINQLVSGQELIFNKNGLPLRYNQIVRNYDKASKAANLPYRGTHYLRHGMATTSRNMFSAEHAQAVTGHKTLRQLEHYAELDVRKMNVECVVGVERFLITKKSQAKITTNYDQGKNE
jgi:integrase